jgi:hypothetical protein
MFQCKAIGKKILCILAVIGMTDMVIQAWTQGEVKLIHYLLGLVFPSFLD